MHVSKFEKLSSNVNVMILVCLFACETAFVVRMKEVCLFARTIFANATQFSRFEFEFEGRATGTRETVLIEIGLSKTVTHER